MPPVLSDLHDHLLTLTLNRPEKKNALTHAMYTLIDDALLAAAEDASVRAVLVRGSGDAFTAGNDLKDFAALSRTDAPDLKDLPVARVIRRIVSFEKPLVAAVHGAAVGFGTTLLLHCDVVLAARSARFSLPFVQLGLVPEFGSSMLLPALAGPVRAAHLLMLGEPFGIDEAQAMGLVSQVCADDTLVVEAEAVCQRLVRLPAASLRAVKRLLHPPDHKARLLNIIEAELHLFEQGLASPEHREAVDAFLEKRPPDFTRFD